ncbi:MAG TPA: RagB/SusD family nutrient uptake outer membrane protein [Chitinophagaceae bacterium]|nr:RagB/SusD family nutrient uptake outer membrane protein [Chitinophagaceae bacterium]
MKHNLLTYILFIAFAMLAASACNKIFLDTQPKGQVLESNYYQNADQAYAGLVSIYVATATETSNTAINWYSNKLGPLNSAGDECYTGGGGSTDMASWQAWNNYTLTAANGPQAGFWGVDYEGIYRANLLLSKIAGGIPGLADADKTRFIAEAKFLRAYFYFELVRLFQNVPLIVAPISSSDWYTITQAKPADVYAQIEKDLNDAIGGLPSVVAASESGRVTKGAAMAELGKVILYQNNNSRMQEAASWFEKVSSSGVYSLLPNFGDIFNPSNKFNSESILEIVHSTLKNAWWGMDPFPGNLYVEMIGPRSYSGPTYWSGGWSFNPIITAFATTMKSDPRYPYTVANIDSIVSAAPGRSYVKGYQNTGYFIQKFAPLQQYVNPNAQPELNFPNDYIEIRLADVYLMEAEALVRGGGSAATAQSYLDRVRARVGLSSVPATLANIYNERKLELATEGHRWYDLVRTGQAATALAFKGFTAGKNELMPIPLNELNNTKLVQNPGY